MKRARSVSIVIPVFNEERTIKQVVQAVAGQNYTRLSLSSPEIIVVDDASTDNTYSIVQRMQASWNIRIFRHETNLGKGAAVRTGLSHVTRDFIIIQDADLEYSPVDYPKLLKPLTSGLADVVYGNRMRLKTEPKFYISLLGNKVLTWVTNSLFGSQLSDVFVGYKAFTKDSIKNAQLICNGFDIEIELTTYFLKHNFRIKEVPISYHGRSWKEGKKITVRDGLDSLYKIIKYRYFVK